MRPQPQRITSAPPSATVRIADQVAAMRRQGVQVLDFSAGRAAEATPEFIARVAADAILSGDTHQTPARGKPEFLAACAAKLARENGLTVDPDSEIIATLGCKQGLTLALLATLDPGDEVIVEDPCFVSYQPTIIYCGGKPVAVPLRRENNFRWQRADLAAAITPRTRAMLFCSPHNPTGTVHSVAEMEIIAEAARRHDLTVICDAIYERVTWGGREFVDIAALPGMKERGIVLMGMTKSFAMGGWRIGFAHAPAEVVAAMTVLQQHLMTCAGSFTQTAAAHALAEAPPLEITGLWRDWERRCEFVVGELDRLPGVSCRQPEGGFYAWLDISATGLTSLELAQNLLREQGVALVPGSAFGAQGEGWLRMTCVKSWDDIRRGVEKIQQALRR